MQLVKNELCTQHIFIFLLNQNLNNWIVITEENRV